MIRKRRSTRAWRILLKAIALLCTTAAPVLAGDGRIEINQARALAGGVSSSDAPGFPVTLESQRSYVLTSSLYVPAATPGIQFPASSEGISLDLNGFTVEGPVACTGTPVSCSARGVADGIRAHSAKDATIRNGNIRGFDGSGVEALFASGLTIESLRVRSNAGDGLRLGGTVTVRDCALVLNGESGLQSVGAGGNLSGLHAVDNGDIAIDLGSGDGGILSDSWIFSTGTALRIGSLSFFGYRDNSIQGAVSGSTGNLGGNICNGSPTCP
ncbi:MAG: right-handed parallel beta-helix repeat-containing protein [bacterium]|nr:right-handed parallel beta-helix repeat-containing protein [bacterium]